MKDALGAVQSVLVLGGTSEIGVAIAKELAAPRRAKVILAGRSQDRLAAAARDVAAHTGATVESVLFDADDTASHERFAAEVFDADGDIDVVVVAFGVLGDQKAAEADAQAAAEVAHTNYVGSVSVMTAVARRLKEQGHGELVVLSSVAGERVRKANFVYGSTKAGLDAFAQGLGDSLHGSGVHVLVVRPGFVKSKMTAGMDPVPLSTTPDVVAKAVAQGLRRGADTVWVPSPLRFVMMAMRHLPRPLFRKLKV
jgi:decaprenylphospho-beta-D-erythro-pentofuranosid-2-ulose 2-reductase